MLFSLCINRDCSSESTTRANLLQRVRGWCGERRNLGRKALPENEPVVYFISPDPVAGPIKIGVSTNLPSRLSQLQTGHYQDLHVIAWVSCDDVGSAYKLESALHGVCSGKCIRNEWFSINAEEVNRLIALIELSPRKCVCSYADKKHASDARALIHQQPKRYPQSVPNRVAHAVPPGELVPFKPVTNMTGRDFLAMLSERED